MGALHARCENRGDVTPTASDEEIQSGARKEEASPTEAGLALLIHPVPRGPV
jgi:hypothetical protein